MEKYKLKAKQSHKSFFKKFLLGVVSLVLVIAAVSTYYSMRYGVNLFTYYAVVKPTINCVGDCWYEDTQITVIPGSIKVDTKKGTTEIKYKENGVEKTINTSTTKDSGSGVQVTKTIVKDAKGNTLVDRRTDEKKDATGITSAFTKDIRTDASGNTLTFTKNTKIDTYGNTSAENNLIGKDGKVIPLTNDDIIVLTSSLAANQSVPTSGATCPGSTSGIGGGQWAQTGAADEKDKSKRLCVQCGGARTDKKQGDGVWGNVTAICGEGAASNYVVRPDEEGKPNNCWKDGAWYANSTSQGGKSCVNGSWEDGIKETDSSIIKESAISYQKLLDKIGECENDKVGKYLGGQCVTKAELDAKTKNCGTKTLSIVTGKCEDLKPVTLVERKPVSTTNIKPTTLDECNDKKSSIEICKQLQGSALYVPMPSSFTGSISYNTGAAVGRPTSLNKDYKSADECNKNNLSSAEECKSFTTTGTAGSQTVYRIVAKDTAERRSYLEYQFGTSPTANDNVTSSTRRVSSSSDCDAGTETAVSVSMGRGGGYIECRPKVAATTPDDTSTSSTSTFRKVSSSKDCSTSETPVSVSAGRGGGYIECRPKIVTVQAGTSCRVNLDGIINGDRCTQVCPKDGNGNAVFSYDVDKGSNTCGVAETVVEQIVEAAAPENTSSTRRVSSSSDCDAGTETAVSVGSGKSGGYIECRLKTNIAERGTACKVNLDGIINGDRCTQICPKDGAGNVKFHYDPDRKLNVCD